MPASDHVSSGAPPGRAGRLWLQHRLDTATQAAALLDHKLRLLRTERERQALRLEQTGAAWRETSREAQVWLLRGAMAGGEHAVRLSCEASLADVEVRWVRPMGVHYPAEATCTLPEPRPDAPLVGNAALVLARTWHRRALVAAVDQAVAEAAVRRLDAESAATRRRLRAIRERWIPGLQEALVRVQLELDEAEHADGLRLRWAAGQQSPPESGARGAADPAEGDRPRSARRPGPRQPGRG